MSIFSDFSMPMFLMATLKSFTGILVDIAIIFVAYKVIQALTVYIKKNS